ncbi:hypothetical protein [Ascidiimonas sp. W6]|uniref:hypothetical protein n=1 Tax=Ascidiimonas meishanensis TaxID=3128903 RepID=UPI0030EE5A58
MYIKINENQLDKSKLLMLLRKGKKIQAIKYIRDQTNLGLKISKDIADNLDRNPDFYDEGKNQSFTSASSKKKMALRPNKGSHFMESKSNSTTFVILFILIAFFALYLFMNR